MSETVLIACQPTCQATNFTSILKQFFDRFCLGYNLQKTDTPTFHVNLYASYPGMDDGP